MITVFTEKSLRKHPELVKALMGIPAEVFWEMIEHIEMRLPDYERQRLAREDRQRGAGAGRDLDQS